MADLLTIRANQRLIARDRPTAVPDGTGEATPFRGGIFPAIASFPWARPTGSTWRRWTRSRRGTRDDLQAVQGIRSRVGSKGMP